jgi:hypothetical protein
MAEQYLKGIEKESGGAVGMELGSILVKFFGMPGLLIIASAVLLISIFLVANTPISRFFDNMFKKHEQRRIFKELEEAETAKIQMAVASAATPGADPDTGIVHGGIQAEPELPAAAGSARSIWKSILNGIMRVDDDADELPDSEPSVHHRACSRYAGRSDHEHHHQQDRHPADDQRGHGGPGHADG